MTVHPGGESLQTIGIERWIQQDDRTRQQFVDLRTFGGSEIIQTQQGCVGTTCLVAMDAAADPKDGWHLGCVHRR